MLSLAARGPRHHSSSRSSLRASPSNVRACLRSAIAWLVNNPYFCAFWFRGAPDPGALPCMRQRVLPCTAGARQPRPMRVLVPQLVGWIEQSETHHFIHDDDGSAKSSTHPKS